MRYLLKVLHLLSLAIFFGSIVTYIFMGELVSGEGIASLKVSRELTASGTLYLTLPALFLTGLTGVLMSGKPNTRWLWSKVIGFILIAVNTKAFIYPAIEASVLNFDKPEAYSTAMQQEVIFGGINLFLILSLIAIAVIKPRFKRKSKPQTKPEYAV